MCIIDGNDNYNGFLDVKVSNIFLASLYLINSPDILDMASGRETGYTPIY
jgi:hypothetical protein|tara:strand:+ start:2714 stop:2863 length:150 start_codon:yes stop_codon:yes gene_type:complete